MRGFADPRALVAFSFVAWACAKATDSDLGGDSYDPRAAGGTGATAAGGSFGTGGSSARGGSSGTGTGGSTSSGGASTAGGSSTTGGATSSGGSSNGTGGSTATGGSTSTSAGGTGTSGTTSEGGAAGEGIPPVLDDADVVIHYIPQETELTSRSVQMRLFFENKSERALALENVSVRYWLTSEATAYALNSYYAAAAISTPALTYVDAGKASYIEARFSSGSVPARSGATTDALNTYEFQIKLDATMGEEQQDDDWSFAPALTSDPAAPNPKITAYAGSKLVWGCEPTGACAGEGGEGGAGGQQGQGGEPGQAGQGGEPAQVGGTGGGAGQGGSSGSGVAAGQGGDTSAGGQAGA